MRRILLGTILLGSLLISLVWTSYAEDVAQLPRWKQFQADFPGKYAVTWDVHTGGPKRIVGTNIFLPFRRIDRHNVADIAGGFVARYADLLNVEGSEAKLERMSSYNNKYLLRFQQYYKGAPVWMARLRLTVSPKGQVLRISSEFYRDIDVSVTPDIDLEAAIRVAMREFAIGKEGKAENGSLTIYPDRKTEHLFLCWSFRLKSGEQRLYKEVFVDAHTGRLVAAHDAFRNQQVRGTVRAWVWSLPGEEGGSPDITPFCDDLTVEVTGVGSDNTNASGYYTITVPDPGTYEVTSVLEGPHAQVENYTGPNASYGSTASTSSDHDWTWNESDHYNEYHLFYRMNRTWHHFYNTVSGFPSNYWRNHIMPGAIHDFDDAPNGWADGDSIAITPNNHYGGIVYHEFTHNVLYRANGYWLGDRYYDDGYAMDEGFADYYSCTFRNDPELQPYRQLDGKMKYPGSGGAHSRGRIIGGACWDFWHKYGISSNYVSGLVYEVVESLPYEDTFGGFMDDLLVADDNDGNIFNGTPNQSQVFSAFNDDHHIMGNYVAGSIHRDMTWENGTIVLLDSA
ncbi:MAG: hypothetical protein V1800_17615 [Candidatus Latescibacterota bacterium]